MKHLCCPHQVNVDGYFQGNHAIDYGLGSRGAAVRPWFIEGEFNVDGTFIDNVSDGRGGVFASNRYVSAMHFNLIWALSVCIIFFHPITGAC
jgi:hypothetical protein